MNFAANKTIKKRKRSGDDGDESDGDVDDKHDDQVCEDVIDYMGSGQLIKLTGHSRCPDRRAKGGRPSRW